MERAFCGTCGLWVPVARRVAGKAVGAVIGAALGGASRSWWGVAIGVVGAAIAGHLVDEAAGAVCGRCGEPLPELV